MSCGRLPVQGLFELLAGLEPDGTLRLDGDRFPGLRIPAGPRLPLADGERSEADERDALTFLERARDARDETIHRVRCRGLRDAGVIGDLPDQCCLVHPLSPPFRVESPRRSRRGWITP